MLLTSPWQILRVRRFQGSTHPFQFDDSVSAPWEERSDSSSRLRSRRMLTSSSVPLGRRRRALVHSFAAGQTDLPVQIHGVHSPALPVAGKSNTGSVFLRRGGAISPVPWPTFSPPFPSICALKACS